MKNGANVGGAVKKAGSPACMAGISGRSRKVAGPTSLVEYSQSVNQGIGGETKKPGFPEEAGFRKYGGKRF